MLAIPSRIIGQCYCIVALVAILTASSAAAKDVVLYGHVVDPYSQPIANAQLKYIASQHNQMLPYDSNGSVSTTTDAEGNFELKFAEDDYRFLTNYQATGVLLCSHPQYQIATQSVPATRLLVDVPLTFELSEQPTPTQVQIVDPSGRPLEGIELRPAGLSTTALPFVEVAEFASTTNPQGIAELPGWPAYILTKIYASGKAIGQQCLTLDAPPSQPDKEPLAADLLATVLPTREVEGKVQIEKDVAPVDHPDLSQITVLLLSRTTLEAEQFTWAEVPLSSEGRIDPIRLVDGPTTLRARFSVDMPFVFAFRGIQDVRTPDGGLLAELYPAILVTGKVCDATTGQGIPNMFVSHFGADNRFSFTNLDGRFQYWKGALPSNGHYISDPFGRYINPDAFYSRPEKLPVDGVIQLEAIQMVPAAVAVGQVRDQENQPVAGAQVTIELTKERFTEQVKTVSDRNGNFRFYQVAEGTQVKLSANKLGLRTAAPLEITLDEEAAPVLQMQPVILRRFVGQVVGEDSLPVANARVTLQHATVYVAEQYQGEDRTKNDLFPAALPIVTDANGRFTSPRTDQAQQDISIVVDAPGHASFHSQWYDYSNLDESQTEVGLPTVRLRQKQSTKRVIVNVVDEATGEAIDNARVVFRGARSGISKFDTADRLVSAELTAGVQLSDGKQVVAAAADGYQPVFQVLEDLPGELTLRLAQHYRPSALRRPATTTTVQLRRMLGRLLADFPTPENDDSFQRKWNYWASQAFADPEGFVEKVEEVRDKGFDPLPFLQATFSSMPIEQHRQLTELVKDNAQLQIACLLDLAKRTEDTAEQTEIFDRVVERMQGFPGQEEQDVASRIACAMLATGRAAQAKELLKRAYDNDPSLQELFERGERVEQGRSRRGIARYFLPEYALVNRRASMKLIELCAFANEIDYLQCEAVVFLASQDVAGWELAAKAFLKNGMRSAGVSSFLRKMNFTHAKNGQALASMLDDSSAKANLLVHLAEHVPDLTDPQRIELLEQALLALQTTESNDISNRSSAVAAEACVLALNWSPSVAEKFAFESIWASEKDQTTILEYSALSNVAKHLASFDATLAQALIEPCFDDWTWLFAGRDAWVVYQRVEPLTAACAIDPDWAEELTQRLMTEQLSGRTSRQLSVIFGLCQASVELLKH